MASRTSLIAIVDRLKGFPEAITAVFPQAPVQTCVVHLIRRSLAFVSYKDRKAVAAALKQIYKANNADAEKLELDDFADGSWGKKYPAISQSWRRNWPEVIPFFAFSDNVRRIIYTTNAIESLNAKLRRAVRTKGHFPTDESALKLLFLVLNLAANARVAVVAARVHSSRVPGPMIKRIGFGNRQGIHVGPQTDCPSFARGEGADDAGAGPALVHMQTESGQSPSDEGRCCMLFEGRLGVSVDVVPPRRHLVVERGDLRDHGHGNSTSGEAGLGKRLPTTAYIIPVGDG